MVVPLVLPNGAAELAELCRRAEATGADSLWAVDHLYWPHPIGEALTTLAVAAVATTRPPLGTCVLQLPLRPPAAVAKQATALQLLSGGRFVLGLGVGIHEDEYERAGVDYHRRGRLMDEGVAGLREAWAPARERLRLRAGAGVTTRPPVVRRAPAPPPGAGPPPSATAGSPSSSRPTSTGPRWRPCGARRPRPAAIPRPSSPASSSSPVSGRRRGAGPGAPGSRSSTGCRPRPSSATWWRGRPDACAAALRRYAEAGARHIVVMVAGSPAVEHFGQLRAAFVRDEERVLAGAPA